MCVNFANLTGVRRGSFVFLFVVLLVMAGLAVILGWRYMKLKNADTGIVSDLPAPSLKESDKIDFPDEVLTYVASSDKELPLAVAKAAEDCMVLEEAIVDGKYDFEVLGNQINVLAAEFRKLYGETAIIASGDVIPVPDGVCYYVNNGSEILYQRSDRSFGQVLIKREKVAE